MPARRVFPSLRVWKIHSHSSLGPCRDPSDPCVDNFFSFKEELDWIKGGSGGRTPRIC